MARVIISTRGVKGDRGFKGWSPILTAVFAPGISALEVIDWVGGEEEKPDAYGYIGPDGLVSDINDAVNFFTGPQPAVLYVQQSLDDDEQSIARYNISALKSATAANNNIVLFANNGYEVVDSNNTIADILNRANHTGEQPVSTITGLQDIIDNLASNTDPRLENAVLYTPQDKTIDEKLRAQSNLGVAQIESDLQANTYQSSDDQKFLYVAGSNNAGDGGDRLLVPTTGSVPPGGLVTNGGDKVWAQALQPIRPEHFGFTGEDLAADTIAFGQALSYAFDRSGAIDLYPRKYRISGGYEPPRPYRDILIRGSGRTKEGAATGNNVNPGTEIILDNEDSNSFFINMRHRSNLKMRDMTLRSAQYVMDRGFIILSSGGTGFELEGLNFESVEKPLLITPDGAWQSSALRDVQFRNSGTIHAAPNANGTVRTLLYLDNVNHEAGVPINSEKILCELNDIRQIQATNFLLEGALPEDGWTILKMHNRYDAYWTNAPMAEIHGFWSEWAGTYRPTYTVDQTSGYVSISSPNNFLGSSNSKYKLSGRGKVTIRGWASTGGSSPHRNMFEFEDGDCKVLIQDSTVRTLSDLNNRNFIYSNLMMATSVDEEYSRVVTSTDAYSTIYEWDGGFIDDEKAVLTLTSGTTYYPSVDAETGRKLVFVPGTSIGFHLRVPFRGAIAPNEQISMVAQIKLPDAWDAGSFQIRFSTNAGAIQTLSTYDNTNAGQVVNICFPVELVDPANTIGIQVASLSTAGIVGNLEVRSFGLYAGRSIPQLIYPDYPKNIITYNNAAPTSGEWKQGDIVINNAPTANTSVGWVCTASGTPGTWVVTDSRILNSLGTAAYLNVGTTANTVAAGDDSRFMSTAERSKLAGIEAGAQVNPDMSLYQTRSEKNNPGGYPGLDASGKISENQLPAVAIIDTFVVASQAEMLALDAQKGDVAVRTDIDKSFILQNIPASTLANWIELRSPTDAVQSVVGLTGNISQADLQNALDLDSAAYQPVEAFAPAIHGHAVATNTSPGFMSADDKKTLDELASKPFRITADRYAPSLVFEGEEGVWLDPFDLSTMFEDVNGRTPAKPGSPVALMLDKSKGLELGPELTENGDFSDDTTGWISNGSGFISSVEDGVLTLGPPTSSGGRYQDITVPIGVPCVVTVRARKVEGTSVTQIAIYGDASFANPPVRLVLEPFTNSEYNEFKYLLKSATGILRVYLTVNSGSGVMQVSNVSVKTLSGNHLSQATVAARPTLVRMPKTGRRNIVDNSDTPSIRAIVSNSTIVSTSEVDPFGGNLAVRMRAGALAAGSAIRMYRRPTSVNQVTQAPFNRSLHIKKTSTSLRYAYIVNDGGAGIWIDLEDMTVATLATNTLDGGVIPDKEGFYRVWYSTNTPTSGGNNFFIYMTDRTSGTTVSPTTGNEELIVFGEQITPGLELHPYQSVTNAFDVTEAGVPDVYYLQGDGVDDLLQSATINGWNASGASLVTSMQSDVFTEGGSGGVTVFGVPATSTQYFDLVLRPNNATASHQFRFRQGNLITAGFSGGVLNKTIPFVAAGIMSPNKLDGYINGEFIISGTGGNTGIINGPFQIGSHLQPWKFYGGIGIQRALEADEITTISNYYRDRLPDA